MAEDTKMSIAWEIILEKMTANIVITEVGARVCVCRIKRGRKTHAFWGNSWYHRMYTVIPEVSHKLRSL